MAEFIKQRGTEDIFEWSHRFSDMHGDEGMRYWTFAANPEGVLFEELTALAQENYLNLTAACLDGEAEGWVEVERYVHRTPAIIKCDCGAEVVLHDDDNDCECGRIYNCFGQQVRWRHDDRGSWEENGGESYAGERWDED